MSAERGVIRLPSLGADMESAELVEWKIAPGAEIRRGDVIALIETDKGLLDLEAFDEGRVAELLAQPGQRLPVGTPLARLEGAPAAPATAPQAAPAAPATAPRAAPAAPAAAPPPDPPVRASPAARQRARAAGIDLARLRGSGPDGAIVLEDVARAAAPRGMRDAIAAAMSRAHREIPQYYASLEVDFSSARAWLGAWNAARPPAERILPAALLLRAVARAATAHPRFNGRYGTAGFEASSAVHLGVAIAQRGGGLVAPAILDAASLGTVELMARLRELVDRARRGRLRSGEFSAATLTVTALGDEGADCVWPIIHPPQVAMVGFGTPRLRPWVVDGSVAAREVLGCTLAADHRVTDGRDGARFLAAIAGELADPGALA